MFKNLNVAILLAAESMSAVLSTIVWFYPPNSKVNLHKFAEASFMTNPPVTLPPVNIIWANGNLFNPTETSLSP